MTKISLIMICSNEGRFLKPTVTVLEHMIHEAAQNSLQAELLLVLNKAEPITKEYLYEHAPDWATLKELNEDQISSAKNAAVKLATGDFITFVEPDELVSLNWLWSAYEHIMSFSQPTILHPAA